MSLLRSKASFKKYQLKGQITSAGEGVEKREPSYTVGGNVNWCSQPLWKTVRKFLKKLKTELPYDPRIPLLGIYTDNTII